MACQSPKSDPIPGLLRKEVIQPQVPLRLPCYDFTPVTNHSLGACLLAVGTATSGAIDSHGVTGGVYKARESEQHVANRKVNMSSANGNSVINLKSVGKVFLTDEVETHALSDVHLEIRHGEYVSISGPSGCGKSTLLSILGLLDSPTSGSYELRGEPVAQLNQPSAPGCATARSASSSRASISSAT